uniref:Enoyl reductase (ER) domain-containing protein n=1 Tax=Panagrolaimus sp. JU765 TaxID=591449 RepID=A0AC34PUW7_9BILA
MSIPTTQSAQMIHEFGTNLQLTTIPVPEPLEDELLVHILYSGLCHTDITFMTNKIKMKGLKVPMVAGHEGAGIVVKIGSKVDKFKVGDKVGLKIITRLCNKCEFCCKQNWEHLCVHSSNLVVNTFGSFQQYATISEQQALKIPDNVDLKLAAPFQCAGVTAYRALKESGVKPGQFVVITGAAGGLGSFALQFAKAMGLRPIALDLTKDKRQHCLDLGAEFYFDGADPNLVDEIVASTNGGPHGVVNLASASKPVGDAMNYIRKTGTIVLVGLPIITTFSIDMHQAILKCIQIKGTQLGTREDFAEAMDFLSRGLVQIPLKVHGLTELPALLDDLDNGKVTGRIVLDTSK